MSSSKSIAAARNRRSGDSSVSQIQRPTKSINGQSNFSQPGAARPPQVGRMPQSQNHGPLMQEKQNGPVPITKLTVSDAIGLVTLRLGRLEQFMLDVQAEGGISAGSSVELPENTQLVDKSVINSIINRLDVVEKREPTKGTGTSGAQLTKLETELKEIKELLLNNIMKFEKLSLKYETHVRENDEKFNELSASVLDLETNISQINEGIELNQIQNDILIENETYDQVEENNVEETVVKETTVINDLKNAIKEELISALF
jgi:hypothetical protein